MYLVQKFSATISTRVKSAIAHHKTKICPHTPTTHSHFQTLSARTSARTSYVRRCDNTHMCDASQRLVLTYRFWGPQNPESKNNGNSSIAGARNKARSNFMWKKTNGLFAVQWSFEKLEFFNYVWIKKVGKRYLEIEIFWLLSPSKTSVKKEGQKFGLVQKLGIK